MDTTGTKWLSRKTWRRLAELHATGRITRRDLERLNGIAVEDLRIRTARMKDDA